MKIESIKQEGDIFTVTFKPSFIEYLFGCTSKIKKYKNTYDEYKYGGGFVYVDKNGKKLGNGNWIGEALDAHQRKF